MAFTGHSGMQTAQSMHSSGSMVRKFGPSRKQSTGHTPTQSVYLQRMHDSRTTWVMEGSAGALPGYAAAARRDGNRELYGVRVASSAEGRAAVAAVAARSG